MKTRGEANVYFIATLLFLKTVLQLPVYCGIDRRSPLSVYTEGTFFLKAAVYQSKLIQQKLIGKGGGV